MCKLGRKLGRCVSEDKWNCSFACKYLFSDLTSTVIYIYISWKLCFNSSYVYLTSLVQKRFPISEDLSRPLIERGVMSY